MKVLVTGSQGFIGSYICNELLSQGYEVIGVDNYQKYGELVRPHDSHEKFRLYNVNILHSDFQALVDNVQPDYIIAGAAMIGGISYFHKYLIELDLQGQLILIYQPVFLHHQQPHRTNYLYSYIYQLDNGNLKASCSIINFVLVSHNLCEDYTY